MKKIINKIKSLLLKEQKEPITKLNSYEFILCEYDSLGSIHILGSKHILTSGNVFEAFNEYMFLYREYGYNYIRYDEISKNCYLVVRVNKMNDEAIIKRNNELYKNNGGRRKDIKWQMNEIYIGKAYGFHYSSLNEIFNIYLNNGDKISMRTHPVLMSKEMRDELSKLNFYKNDTDIINMNKKLKKECLTNLI